MKPIPPNIQIRIVRPMPSTTSPDALAVTSFFSDTAGGKPVLGGGGHTDDAGIRGRLAPHCGQMVAVAVAGLSQFGHR